MNRLIVVFFGAMMAFYGCQGSNQPEMVIPVDVGDAAMADEVREMLDREGIWYRDAGKSTLELGYPPPKDIINYVNSRISEKLPPGRSSSFPNEMLIEIMNRLDHGAVPYDIVEHAGGPWLVWSKEDAEVVESVIGGVDAELKIQEISEEGFQYELQR